MLELDPGCNGHALWLGWVRSTWLHLQKLGAEEKAGPEVSPKNNKSVTSVLVIRKPWEGSLGDGQPGRQERDRTSES